MTPMLLLTLAGLWSTAAVAAAPAGPTMLEPCRLRGVEHDAACGSIRRPLDPAAPGGTQIDIHFAVLPALARNKLPDPVFFFAGGPGQSATALAGPVSRMLGRFGNRRDVVLIDQRGTGRSAPLHCDADAPTRPLREAADPVAQVEALRRCRVALGRLPYGDLRHFTTVIASADAEAVRQALGVRKVNLVGGSYGTRAALDYLRQFPQSVRRVVIDGVAPPDMALPVAGSTDAQAAFDAVLAACEAEPRCLARHPQLRSQWRAVLDSLPRPVTVPHPVIGRDETLTLTRDMLLTLLRAPMYVPAFASALPHAVAEAAEGRFTPLLGLASAMGGSRDNEMRLAMGMHFSVVCAEDVPRMDLTADRPGADFGSGFAAMYREACTDWPRGAVPPAFYDVPPSPAPVLVLSGGIDPVTPPRHGARVARALGAKARHVVLANAGHGVMSIGCMRDVVFRFVDAEADDEALRVDAACAERIPRPPAFGPVRAPASGAVEGGK